MNRTLAYLAAAMSCIGCVAALPGCASHDKAANKMTGGRGSQQLDPSAVADATIEAEPKILPRTHYTAGRLLEQRGDFQGAIAQYRRAAALNHRYVDALNRLGVTLDRVGRFEEADQAFTDAIYVDPGAPFLRNNLAFSYMLQQRWSDAEAELRNALLLDPEFTRARVNLGLVLARQQRFDDALAAFCLALPEPDAHYNMGLAYRGQGMYAEALRSFEMALAVDPRLKVAAEQIAAIQEKTGIVESSEPSPPAAPAQLAADTESRPDEAARRRATGSAEAGAAAFEPSAPPPAAAPPTAVESATADADIDTLFQFPADAPPAPQAGKLSSSPDRPDYNVEEAEAASALPNSAVRIEAPEAAAPPEDQRGDVMDFWYPARVPSPAAGDELPAAGERPTSAWRLEALDLAEPLDEATMSRPSLFIGCTFVRDLGGSAAVPVQTIAVGGEAQSPLPTLREAMEKARSAVLRMKNGIVNQLLRLSMREEGRAPNHAAGRTTLSYHGSAPP